MTILKPKTLGGDKILVPQKPFKEDNSRFELRGVAYKRYSVKESGETVTTRVPQAVTQYHISIPDFGINKTYTTPIVTGTTFYCTGVQFTYWTGTSVTEYSIRLYDGTKVVDNQLITLTAIGGTNVGHPYINLSSNPVPFHQSIHIAVESTIVGTGNIGAITLFGFEEEER